MGKIPLLLDGAMGTELQYRNVEIPLPLWTADANISHPDVVTSIHSEYINAGADIITTNTFRSTSWTYRKTGLNDLQSQIRAKNSLYSAVECAHNASNVLVKIAGSITSIDDCYLPEKFPGRSIAHDIYGQTLEWLIDAGVDVILFETMGNAEEIDIALSLSSKYKNAIWLSVIMKDSKRILDGTHIKDIFSLANRYSVQIFIANCNIISKTILLLKQFHLFWGKKWGVYPNLGETDYDNNYFKTISEKKFSNGMKNILKYSPNLIGGCCGSRPKHIKILKNLLIKGNKDVFENKA